MTLSEHTQTLTDFRDNATQTLDRLNATGEAEVLTVDGEARAVLLAPDVFDQLAREAQLARDVESIRKSLKNIEEGRTTDAESFFAGLRAKLRDLQSARQKAS